MRVFVAGASGAIGRPLVAKLIAAGHEVTGTTRSEARAAEVRAAGADASLVDAFDADALRTAVERASPEVIVHELTSLPDRIDFRKEDTYTATNRVRTEGTRNLIDAARAAGARRFVCQSIAFAYRMDGAALKTEEDPLLAEAPGTFGSALGALREMEEMVLASDGLDGLVLRYAFFYGPGTYYADDGTSTQDVRRRRLPIVGKGSGVFSFIHVDDAADATVAAVERGAPGVYNVSDDEPAPPQDVVAYAAELMGLPVPPEVAFETAELTGMAASFWIECKRVGNARIKADLGVELMYPTYREGLRALLV